MTNNKNESCLCEALDWGESFWNKYRHHSAKISIGLSILGGVSAILVGKFIIGGAICLAITNSAIFISGLALEKANNDVTNLETHNETLKKDNTELNEFRRTTMANYNFPISSAASPTPRVKSENSTQTNKSMEEVVNFTSLLDERRETNCFISNEHSLNFYRNEPSLAFN
jgi:hypothetical protein